MKTHSLFRLGSIAAASALLLACGGGNDNDSASDTPAALKAGDSYSVDILVGDGVASTREYLLHGITRHGELVTADAPELVPGALIPLPAETMSKADGGALAPSHAALRSFYKQLWDATAAHEGTSDPAVIARELADLDSDLPTLQADLNRSNLSPSEYVAFYDALDDVAMFAREDGAEAQLQGFFDAVGDIELQGASCHTMAVYYRGHPCYGLNRAQAAAVAPKADTTTASPRQSSHRHLLDALEPHNLSWTQFLQLMEARGDDFYKLTVRYHDWALSRETYLELPPIQQFVNEYLQTPVAKSDGGPDAMAPRNAAGAGAVMQGVGALLSLAWDIIKNSKPVVDAASTQNFILSTDDANPMHYAGAKKGESETVTVKFRSPGVTWAEAQYKLDGYYGADHLTIPGRWMPQVNFNVLKASAKWTISLNVRANITAVVNVGTHARPMPVAQVRVDVVQGSFFNSKPKQSWFQAKGDTGFTLISTDQ